MNKICFIVTCMGRLSHIQKTAPWLLNGNANFSYVLSDYGCPENSGSWLEKNYPEAYTVRSTPEIKTVNGKHTPIFKKTRANNAGARFAMENGAEYLCFIDADSIVHEGFHDWIYSHVNIETFIIVPPDYIKIPKVMDLYGLCCTHKSHFQRIGGFNEGMNGWGGDDVDLKVKLYAIAGINWQFCPTKFLDPIPHRDDLRMKYHQKRCEEKEMDSTNNLGLMLKTLESHFGCPYAQFPKNVLHGIAQMLGMPGSMNGKFFDNEEDYGPNFDRLIYDSIAKQRIL